MGYGFEMENNIPFKTPRSLQVSSVKYRQFCVGHNVLTA